MFLLPPTTYHLPPTTYHYHLQIDRPRPHFTARAAMAPPDDAAVRESLHVLNFSTARARQRMRQIARAPPSARHGAAVLLIRVAAILNVVHASLTYYSARQRNRSGS